MRECPCFSRIVVEGLEELFRDGVYENGLMAEWLGKGLQNLVQRFESASDLTETAL